MKSIKVRLGEVRLLSLEDRLDRSIADVVFFYKVINDHTRLTLGSRVRFSRDVDRGYELRSMDTSNVLTCYSSTNLFKYSFLNRVVGEWNNCFPYDVADFKSKVFRFLAHFLISVYII